MKFEADRQRQITALYHAALERDEGDRAAFLREACADDDVLRRDVESLLGYEDAAAPFLERPAMEHVAPFAASRPESTGDLVGRRLGVYQVEARIGAGGMGEVYRARDTRLGRDVAIKVLPPHLMADADRRARFEREARVLATLNHSNIAQIYGLEESDGLQTLVMELVPGETLDRMIRAHPHALKVEAALALARQIADAVDAAHERGVIHRDLKPANIVVTPDGVVKVLDFGLAKAAAGDASGPDLSQSPTITAHGTSAGLIIGTPAYMSPEQARGRPLDKRTDIWAFGCVLYEMLTGRLAFRGETMSDTIAAILEREPDWSVLPAGIPSRIRSLLERCLRKDLRRRLHDIGDARIEIDEAGNEPDPVGVPATPAVSQWRRGYAAWAISVALVVSAAALVIHALFQPASDSRVVRFDVFGPEGSAIVVGQPLSPDGRTLAFVAGREIDAFSPRATQGIWVRPLDSASATPLPGTEGASRVFWSPDSQYIGFFAHGRLMMVARAGGPPSMISTAAGGRGWAGTWSVKGVILFSWPNGPLLRVPVTGGEPLPATQFVDKETRHHYPEFLPDGRHFLYTAESADGLKVYVGTLDSDERRLLPGIHSAARYSPTGHVVFLRNRTLMAQPFDPRSLQLSGEAFPISLQVFGATITAAPFSISSNGSLAYQAGGSTPASQLVWFDRGGKQLRLAAPTGAYVNPELSPNGRRVAFGRGEPPDIWVRDLDNGIDTRFSFHPARDFTPIWSPDEQTIAFYSEQDLRVGIGNIYTRSVGVVGEDKRLLTGDGSMIPADWSRDGRYLAYTSGDDVWVLPDPLSDNPKPQRVTETSFTETNPRISPNGHWIAYESTQSKGQREIYIQSFPQAGTMQQVSSGGGLQPRWKSDSSELFYVTPDFTSVMVVSIKPAGASLTVSAPVLLFKTLMSPFGLGRSYSVSDDGRFLINVAATDQTPAPITVIHNWAAGRKE